MVQTHTAEALACPGGQRDGTGLSRTDLTNTIAKVRTHCAETEATATSTETKVGSMKLVACAKARNKAKHFPWSLRELEDINKLPNKSDKKYANVSI